MTHSISARPLVDIGANLAHDSFDHDRDEVLERARDVGISHMLLTGSSLASTRRVIELCQGHDWLFGTAGIHPHEARNCGTEVMQQIRELSTDEQIVAVGETGLDFNRDYSPRDIQEKVFSDHLELACESGKAIFLHQRDAHSRFMPMLREFRDRLSGGVVHCFTDERKALYDYLDLDMYIGITGWVCDERRGRELQKLVGEIPADRLMLETDAPYLLPRNMKPKPSSRRNEPCYLPAVLRTVAVCRQVDEQTLAEQTTANAIRLFRLPPGTP